jgi:hypothetical protein
LVPGDVNVLRAARPVIKFGGGDDVNIDLQCLHAEVNIGPNAVGRRAIRAASQDLVDGEAG